MDHARYWLRMRCTAALAFLILSGCGGVMESAGPLDQPPQGTLEVRLSAPLGSALSAKLAFEGEALSLSRREAIPESGLLSLEVPRDRYELEVQVLDAGGSVVRLTRTRIDLLEQEVATVDLGVVQDSGQERALDSPPVAAAPTQPPPNIVLIVADDLDFFDLGCNLGSEARTPRIDQLASQGMRFRNYYSNAAKCSPSRAALLTSRSPACFGWTDVIQPYYRSDGSRLEPARGLPASVPTMAQVLQGQGYATGMIGKWHVGFRSDYRPAVRGFAEVAEWVTHSPDFSTGGGFYWGFRILGAAWGSGTIMPALGQPGADDHYLSKELTDRAIDFVNQNSAGPFFLYLAHVSPHQPQHVPARFDNTSFGYDLTTVEGKTSAMISDLDREVGRLVDHIDSLGLGASTLIVVVSDNGGISSGRAGNLRRQAVMRGWKGSLYEGGIHVPMIARWPGRIPAGTVNATVCSSLDLLPTFASLSGALPPAGVEGRDLSSNLTRGHWSPAPEHFWVAPRFRSYANAKAAGASPEQLDQFAIRSGNFKLVRGPDQSQPGLYDVTSFQGELTDLSAANPALVATMLARYKSWHASESQVPAVLTPVGSTLAVPFDSRFDFADGDFTFSIDASTTDLTQRRTLASRPGCWELNWIDDRVRLRLYDDRPGTLEERAVHLQTQPLSSGVTHRISFSVYGQTWRSNRILSLYVDGALAQRLLPDAYPPGKSFYAATPSDQPITVGSRSDGTARFLGTLSPPRIFTLALPVDELSTP
ncbi:MAG: hypothetical protein AMXMBFR33_42620 [Candidatus Xenobia bacterium]